MERQIAFITGASRGIGAAAALALAERGYDVVLTARTVAPGERHDHGNVAGAPDLRPLPGSLEETAAAVRTRGREALALRADLLDAQSLADAVDETEKQWGPIDVLLNNGIVQTAGVMDHVRDLTAENVERIYRGNVLAPLWLVQRVLPTMVRRGRGTIVNMVSESGFTDPPAPAGEGGWGFAYSSSKSAIARLVGVLAVEYRDSGLRFFNVEPGFIVTEMVKATGLLEHFGPQWGGAPPEVPAAVITWLVTDPAAQEWHGKTVSAQKLCKQLGLVPGWPPPKPGPRAR
jgi:NAD(P)-dependent dehydrogenase (short-subunit alcohol dehydrogenase family)